MPQNLVFAENDVIEVLRHLNSVVVSLDRLVAARADLPEDVWQKAVTDYVLTSQALKAMSQCRAVLARPFPNDLGADQMSVLERALEDGEFWSSRAFLAQEGRSPDVSG